jgi:hypothetical protein
MGGDDTKRSQLAENMRFYADMRFKQLTLLLAWLTIAAAGVAVYGQNLLVGNLCVRQTLALGSLLFTAVMWVMEVRASLYWRANREAAPDLWPRPRNDCFSWINATNALLVLHITIYLFWLWCASAWNAPKLPIWVFISLGILLLIFSLYSYWSNRLGRSIVAKNTPKAGAAEKAGI